MLSKSIKKLLKTVEGNKLLAGKDRNVLLYRHILEKEIDVVLACFSNLLCVRV